MECLGLFYPKYSHLKPYLWSEYCDLSSLASCFCLMRIKERHHSTSPLHDINPVELEYDVYPSLSGNKTTGALVIVHGLLYAPSVSSLSSSLT